MTTYALLAPDGLKDFAEWVAIVGAVIAACRRELESVQVPKSYLVNARPIKQTSASVEIKKFDAYETTTQSFGNWFEVSACVKAAGLMRLR